MSYDPEARRDTPLALKLKERIRHEGPISVAAYMRACLQDPEHGYYRKQPAIGARGDFVTAPEISQVFGELIGLWCAVVWQQMGAPTTVHLVELGPGRGTMMRDALRAARVVPGFVQALQVTLIEASPVLRDVQKSTLADLQIPITWCDDTSLIEQPFWHDPSLPMIVVGNEFLDVLAPEQYMRQGDAWVERQVSLDAAGRLIFATAPHEREGNRASAALSETAGEGDVFERWRGWGVVSALAARCTRLAGLLIDYGHVAPALGDTLQAVREQRPEHPLTSPGEADLTNQVDFGQLAHDLHRIDGIAIDGPVTQAEFLGRLGIVERASRLMTANPTRATEIEAGVARLIAPNAMGSRFKAIGLRSANLPPLPGLAP